MKFFSNLIRPTDLDHLLNKIYGFEDGINTGDLISYDPLVVLPLMRLWCRRVDNLIKIDKEVYGHRSRYAHIANSFRGFTYEEYEALFNKHIIEEEFPFYPVFNQLRRKEGGINFEKQRSYFTSRYEFNEEDYVKILCENGFEPVLSFFLSQRAKLSAMLPLKALFSHSYVVAPSGTGKSELLKHIFYRLQKKYPKYSLILIDPHGDLAESVRLFKLNRKRERLIYIDPFFKDGMTPTFNPFEIYDRSIQNITHVVEQNILAYEEILSREGGSLTEAMINMLEKSLYFLLSRPDSSILDLESLLSLDPEILAEAQAYDTFFDDSFISPRNRTREGLYFRISRLLNSPVLKNFLGGKSTFNLEKAINSNKVIIFNLGSLGEMTQVAIGKLIIANLKSYVRKRKKGGLLHTFFMVDEAHNFVTGSFEFMLSQLRGFGLHCIFANQYIKQLKDQVEAVEHNTAIKIVAGEKYEDMKKMVKLSKEDTLGKYEFFLQVRHRSLLKFKSPSVLLRKPHKYQLTHQEVLELDGYLVKNYYKPIGGLPLSPGFRGEALSLEEEVEILEDRTLTKPPFDLIIPDDND